MLFATSPACCSASRACCGSANRDIAAGRSGLERSRGRGAPTTSQAASIAARCVVAVRERKPGENFWEEKNALDVFWHSTREDRDIYPSTVSSFAGAATTNASRLQHRGGCRASEGGGVPRGRPGHASCVTCESCSVCASPPADGERTNAWCGSYSHGRFGSPPPAGREGLGAFFSRPFAFFRFYFVIKCRRDGISTQNMLATRHCTSDCTVVGRGHGGNPWVCSVAAATRATRRTSAAVRLLGAGERCKEQAADMSSWRSSPSSRRLPPIG